MMSPHTETGSVPAPQARLWSLLSPTRLPGTLALPENGTWSQEVEPGATLRVRSGRAWVTFEGDPEDHVLDAGGSFTAPTRGRLAAWALTDLRVELTAARRAA